MPDGTLDLRRFVLKLLFLNLQLSFDSRLQRLRAPVELGDWANGSFNPFRFGSCASCLWN